MEIAASDIKELRERTGAGIMECKKVLAETGGNMDKAIALLRERGLVKAAKRVGKVAAEGVVDSYIHMGGRIGVLVEVNCETDFVARTDEFRALVKEIAMQIAAARPMYVKPEDVPENLLNEEREIYRAQALNEGKPERVVDKIVEGRIEKFYKEVCLIEQPYIRDPERSVRDLVAELTAKVGENITVRRFARFELGEGIEREAQGCGVQAQAQPEK